jgi:glycine dehydrogenase
MGHESHTKQADLFAPNDTFVRRHIGPNEADVNEMLSAVGVNSLGSLMDEVVPEGIRRREPLALPEGQGEHNLLKQIKAVASQNKLFRSLIGMGYADCIVPGVIQRNILENPGWYTQYTPYQAEISQGRMEALINFQTMVSDLTGLELANASLLDEGTAAAEAMAMSYAIARRKKKGFFVANDCHPQTISVIETRAEPLGLELYIADPNEFDFAAHDIFGVLLQYPGTDGRLVDYGDVIQRAHDAGALVTMAAELMSLLLLKAPGEWGADIAIGSTQRFGVPMGFGGPHAAYMSTKMEYRRQMPGRLIGVSKDVHGKSGYRLSLQTREQHIRRDRATSNICTSQVLLAVMAGMYAVYHGPDGLRDIAGRIHEMTATTAEGLKRLGFSVGEAPFFDTLRIETNATQAETIRKAALAAQVNLRYYENGHVGLTLDETCDDAVIMQVLQIFAGDNAIDFALQDIHKEKAYPAAFARTSEYLTHEVFHSFRCEHEMLRYIHRLQNRDLSLTHSMIPLGSCTMKLNATTEMVPVTWPEFGALHPFAPKDQTLGYQELFDQLEAWLAEITGFSAVSLQPNAGSQGEYAGLLCIRAYHKAHKEHERDVCLIPVSAHGTNPASAVMAGMRVVAVTCNERGDIDVDDLRAKAEQHKDKLAALMITYPSTHGVFEERVAEVCQIVHDNGGLVYMDGANMNAQVGLCRPGDIGADVCHLNLHKTFCIPHGGGGPGMGPIGVNDKLKPFLPSHPLVRVGGEDGFGPVSAAPYGSPSILPISWSYIALMGGEGLKQATEVAILNANYMATRLGEHYDVLYTGPNNRVAHEFVLDLRPFKATAGIEVVDVAKRLMDYGFHAPTMSWPVPGTLMVEPTESESKAELDRFCDAMIQIRREIQDVIDGKADATDNVLKNAPHPLSRFISAEWSHSYSRQEAAFPTPWVQGHKFWPAVGRIDDAFGDRNLVCTCIPTEDYA